VIPQLPQCILLIPRALDDRARLHPLRRDILQDIPQLVRRRRLLGHIELELAAQLVLGVVRLIGGLVLRGCFGGGCVRGAEDVQHACGSGQGGFVEEGDDVEGFVLDINRLDRSLERVQYLEKEL
jgi:hypothetical protein